MAILREWVRDKDPACVYVCTMCVYSCVCVFLSACVCVYACMCVYVPVSACMRPLLSAETEMEAAEYSWRLCSVGAER